mmetsp:Transcript_63315/g.152859  ORF Transcript_63315/g.152859 Transcript_63315/m.152859 type:complete len:311 (-) Transcript_63315:1582-2514(-)
MLALEQACPVGVLHLLPVVEVPAARGLEEPAHRLAEEGGGRLLVAHVQRLLPRRGGVALVRRVAQLHLLGARDPAAAQLLPRGAVGLGDGLTARGPLVQGGGRCLCAAAQCPSLAALRRLLTQARLLAAGRPLSRCEVREERVSWATHVRYGTALTHGGGGVPLHQRKALVRIVSVPFRPGQSADRAVTHVALLDDLAVLRTPVGQDADLLVVTIWPLPEGRVGLVVAPVAGAVAEAGGVAAAGGRDTVEGGEGATRHRDEQVHDAVRQVAVVPSAPREEAQLAQVRRRTELIDLSIPEEIVPDDDDQIV